MPGNGTTALRRVRMPDELEQIASAARLGRRRRAGRAPQAQSPARGAPDRAPRSGAA
jgi:hypothetical protein